MGESSNRQLLAEELKRFLNKDLSDNNKNVDGDTDIESDDEDNDQKFIKKETAKEEAESEEKQEVGNIIDHIENLKNLIKPVNNQQRNLDREVGGLEEKQKESSEKDVWDNRSEEVDKMGSTDTFNTTGMKSVIWQQKRNRLRAKKLHEAGVDAATVNAVKNGKTKMNESSFDNMGYVQRLKNLKQDHSHESNGGRGI